MPQTLEEYKAYVGGRLQSVTEILPGIAMGDFSKRLDIPPDEDEFTELYAGINYMLEDIQENLLERKKAEEQLKESEQRYRDIVELALDGIVTIDMEGNVTSCNKSFLDITGFSSDEIIEKHFSKIPTLRAKDVPTWIKMFASIIKGKTPPPLEIEWVHKDGTHNWGEARISLMRRGGDITGVQVITRDITERKQAKEREEQHMQDIQYLSGTAMGFVKLAPDADIYEHITENLYNLTGDSIVIVNSFDPKTNLLTTRSVLGFGKLAKSALKILGQDPVGNSYKINEKARRQLLTGEYHKVPGKLYELTFGEMPKPICKALEKLFGIREIHSMGLTFEGKILGNAVIILRNKTRLENTQVIETYLNQAAVALQRRRSEVALSASEDRYRSLVEKAGAGIATSDLDGNFIYVNDALSHMIGYPEGELIGKPFLDFIHPEDQKLIFETFMGAFEDPTKEVPLEFRVIHKDGHVLHMFSKPTVLWEGHEIAGFNAIITDITDRKRAEEELHESKEKLQSIFDNVNDVIIHVDPEGNILEVNQRVEEIFGLKREEAIGKNFMDLGMIDDKDLAKLIKLFIGSVEEGDVISKNGEGVNKIEFKINNKDGMTLFVETSTAPLKKDGELVGFSTVLRDITDRKKTAEILEKNEKRFRSLVENSSEITMIVDENGDISYITSSVEKILGYKSEDIIGTSAFDFVHPDDMPYTLESFGRVLKKQGVPVVIELRASHNDGSWRTILVTGNNLLDDPEIAGVVVNYHDITERKNAEKRQTLNSNILSVINTPLDWNEVIQSTIEEIKVFTGFSAVGIRLKEGEDYPYYISSGFPSIFIEAERYLCSRDSTGELIRDSKGKPYLECMCGNVISGRTDPIKVFFTKSGSFWTNSTTKLLGETTDEDRQTRTRNRCNIEGYESVALIPLIAKDETIGLIQLNDKRKNMFTLDLIEFYEKLGEIIGISFSKWKSEEALKDSEARLRRFYDSDLAGFARTRVSDGKLLDINNYMVKMLGYEDRETCLKEYIGSEHWVDPNGRQQMLTQLIKAGQVRDLELPITPRDGSQIWVSYSAVLYPEDDYIEFVVTDISEQKQAKEKLEESESRYKNLFKESPVSIWEEDYTEVREHIENLRKSGIKSFSEYFKQNPDVVAKIAAKVKIMDVNDATIQMYGASNKEELFTDLNKVFTKESLEVFREGLITLIEGNLTFQSEGITQTLKGVQNNIFIRWSIPQGFEETWSRILVSIIDISELKKAEEALYESEEKYSSVVENSKDAIVIHQEGIIKFVNSAAAELTGFSEIEFLEKNIIQFITPEFHELVLQRYAERKDGKDVPSIYEISLLKKDKSIFPVEINSTIINYKEKPAALVFLRDLTERKKMTEELLQSEKLASIGQLAAGMAHEVNTPLTNISLITENMMKMTNDPELVKKLKSLSEQRRMASNIVSSLLSFSRKIEPRMKMIKLDQVLSDSISSLENTKPKNINIIGDFEKGIPKLKGDSGQLRQAFSNLIDNAYGAMPEGGELTITAIQKGKDHIEIKFADTGIGISKEDMEHVFDPFFTKKEVGDGVGLGLSICHGIIEAHKGTIGVDSEKGKGTTFTITLPEG